MSRETITEIRNELFKMLYENDGLQKIIDYAFTLLGGNLIGLSDTSYRNIITSTEFKSSHPVILKHKQKGFLSGDALAALKNDKVINRLQQSTKPFFASPSANFKYDIAYLEEGRWLFVPIRIHGVLAAFMTIPEENGPFPENALEIAETLAQALSLELQKSDFYHENKQLFYEALLFDIIGNRTQNEETLRKRVKDIGKSLSGKLFILIFRPDPDKTGITDSVLDILSHSSLRNYFPDCLSMIYQREAVLLIGHEGSGFDLGVLGDEFSDFLSGNHLTLSVSNPFDKLTEAPVHYMQATEAMHLGERLLPGERIYRYEDLSILHCLSEFRKDNDLRSLCIPVLYEMHASGKEADKNMLSSLFLYLRHMKDVSAVTKELHIHKNTLFYRIRKISEMTGLDLNNGDDVFRIFLSDLILTHYDRL